MAVLDTWVFLIYGSSRYKAVLDTWLFLQSKRRRQKRFTGQWFPKIVDLLNVLALQ